MSSTQNVWMVAKKSQKEIERDKKKAIAAKRQKNRRTTPSFRGKSMPKKKKSSYADDSDFSDETDVDDFIVGDDDDVEIAESEDEAFDSNLEDEDDDDDEEEIVLHDDEDSDDGIEHEVVERKPAASSRSSRATARGGTRNDALSIDSDSDDDDDEGDSFLPTANIRRSAPSKLLQQKAEAAKNRFNPSLEASLANTEKRKRQKSGESSLMQLKAPALKKHKTTTSTTSRSSIVAKRENKGDDGEELTSPLYTPNKSMNRSKSRPEQNYEEVFSSDEENTINHSNTNGKKPHVSATAETSRYFGAQKYQKRRTFLDDSDSDSDDEPRKAQYIKKNNNHALEDTPDPSNQDRKRRLNKKITKMKGNGANQKAGRVVYSIEDSSDEDDTANAKRSNLDDSGFDDEDLRVAMKMSLQESKKSSKEEKKKKAEEAIEMILDESSDEEDGDQGEEYYDEEKETASNVLRSAEQLSGHVVRAMSGWFRNDSKNQTESGGAIQGIIVDGALALGNVDESNSGNDDNGDSNGSHKWISKAVMAKAIPKVTLSGYQLIGVNWMALLNGMTCEVGKKRTKKNVNGVLADEMGLGKTVQTIAFLAWLKYRRQAKVVDLDSAGDYDDEEPSLPHLIVVPVSTLPNWIREFEKFCPDMHVIKYHGSQQEREAMKEDLREHLPKYHNKYVMKRTKLDVIVAPVSYFQRENSPDRKFLSSFKYDYLVVDEAHNLKNAKSTRYKMLDKVKTDHRLLLTGTPVQNNPQELLNMLSFIMPLFSKAGSPFEENENYSEQMLKHFVDEKAEHGDEQTAYKKLKQLFAPFVLRRRKADVIAQLLPKKERKTEFVELSESTRAIYKSIIQAHFNKNGDTINPGTGEHLFTNLRKCAHHPLLLRTRWNTPDEKRQLVDLFYRHRAFKGDGCTKERVAEELQSWNDFDIHLTAIDLISENEYRREDLGRYVLPEKDLFSSSKFTKLKELLPELIEADHRILIFSSWTSCLDLLGCLLEHLKIRFQRMDGSCPSDERQRLIDLFNTDLSLKVFLLSTKACGLGINLTSADTCIIHDLDFNPFNDLQAEDRCHRIGQKKPVTVYKLIARDSVDEDIYKMQEKKAKMNAAIMDSAASKKEKSEILKNVLQKAGQADGSKSDSTEEVFI